MGEALDVYSHSEVVLMLDLEILLTPTGSKESMEGGW